jgi:hypothetical protein
MKEERKMNEDEHAGRREGRVGNGVMMYATKEGRTDGRKEGGETLSPQRHNVTFFCGKHNGRGGHTREGNQANWK